MRFLVDRCAGRHIADWLRGAGHEVLECRELGKDPGDLALLELAHAGHRILVTIDTDFGKLLYLDQLSHSGLVRLPDVPSARRIELLQRVIERHADDLSAGAVITVKRGRIRISRPQS